MNKVFFLVALAGALLSCQQDNTHASAKEDFIDSLMAQMTLKEKIGQMNQYSVGAEMTGPNAASDHAERYQRFIKGEVGSVLNTLGAENTRKLQQLVVDSTRLGIPLIFAYDVIHGYQTMFPIPLAEAASWDTDLIQKSAELAAREATAAGLHWTFAPMVDVSRDARWGRVMEGAGEDPYLGSIIAEARIRGFQGSDLNSEYSLAACAKHFAGYGFVESGKDYNSVSIGRHGLHNYILPPFKAAVEANVATFMNAFNDIDGIPATAHPYILRDVLDQKWKFSGVVVSDWNSIGELVNHGVAADKREAAQKAILAGSDIDMEGDAYIQNLEDLVKEGVISERYIDQAVRQILGLKYDLGLFEDPFRYSDPQREKEIIGNPVHHQFAREIAAQSIVLLKNNKGLLPLKNVRSLGVIGPLAKDKDSPLGNWRAAATPNSAVSLYEGIEARFGTEMKLQYAEGCKLSIGPNNFFQEVEIETKDKSGFAEAIEVAKNSDVVIMALGETAYMSGEARSRADIGLPGLQLELLKAVYEVNPNIVLVLMNGRPLAIPWEEQNIPAIVEAWHLGSQAGHAIADVLSGDVNPSGKLPMSFPRHVGQLPVYYNHLNTGRPSSDGAVFYVHHMDVDSSPLYPFGFGLSYTSFRFNEVTVKETPMGARVELTVVNTGDRDGQEVVQVYIRDNVATISRPVKELKAFKKVFVKAGSSEKVVFELTKEDLSYLNDDGDPIFESGEFEIQVGPNSRDVITKTIIVN